MFLDYFIWDRERQRIKKERRKRKRKKKEREKSNKDKEREKERKKNVGRELAKFKKKEDKFYINLQGIPCGYFE